MRRSQIDGEFKSLVAPHQYRVIDAMPAQVYDDLTLLAARMLNTPGAALGIIGADHLWFKSIYGVQLAPLCVDESFCRSVLADPLQSMIFPDTWRHSTLRESALVRGRPFIRAYAGTPLIPVSLDVVGVLCVMDTAPRHFTHDEIEILRTLARQAGSQLDIRARATLLESANEKLMALATCDSLTGLKNHRAFQDTLDEELDFAARNRAPLSVVLIDVDSFKDYNDTFGHPAGDEILQAISILLLESSREYDCVARYGGEEFALVLRDADVREAHAVAERLRRHIAEANWPERGITASVGVATVSNEATTRDVLVAEADRLLYKAKQSGKNRVCCESEAEFDPSVWDNAPQLRFKWGATSFKN